uniref:Phosphatidylglycerophosphatase and protein-tyrosine phosphatase 1 n=1 Tax=Leptobrachium leishanense TaxID=445787 RepID=A0A8C5QI18_9ANUR
MAALPKNYICPGAKVLPVARRGQGREGGSASREDGGRGSRRWDPEITFPGAAAMPVQWLAARVFFYPTLLYNVVMKKVTDRNWYDRIDETVILGALPFRGLSRTLIDEENVRGVITMNEEYETRLLCNSAEQWEALGVEQLRLSTLDFTGVPTLENLKKGVAFINEYRTSGNSVYIHCKAGRSRSATMVAAYLIERHKWTPDYTEDFIAGIRPHIIIRHSQHQVLEKFYRLTTGSKKPQSRG